jgi:uncharacterized protein (TIGR02118 family)
MPTKITVIYDNPQDPDAFEAGYHQQHALAKQIPGVRRVESAKVAEGRRQLDSGLPLA